MVAQKSITVAGAGILGLWQAFTLANAGHRVRLVEAAASPFERSSSRWAAAMIAPECESEASPPIVRDMGRAGLDIWRAVYPGLAANGTLVVAAVRDRSELTRFQRVTEGSRLIHAGQLGELEPMLADRFDAALYFPGEAHMNAVDAMSWLLAEVQRLGVEVVFGEPWNGVVPGDAVIDCRGIDARHDLAELRGVRGERIVIEARDVSVSRPVRLLHPRQPIYIVPQGNGRYVLGATVIEREDDGPMTLKSALDLLGSAYAVHPAFAEASIIDMGAGVRPAFPDHVPRIVASDDGRVVRVNGAYRHGFLLAPVLAKEVADMVAHKEQQRQFVHVATA